MDRSLIILPLAQRLLEERNYLVKLCSEPFRRIRERDDDDEGKNLMKTDYRIDYAI